MRYRHLYAEGVPEESVVRQAAVALAKFAVDAAGAKHRVFGDAVFGDVTEGRCKWPGYSACGDLCHWLMYRLGVRNERIINRTTDGGKIPWVIGANISRIVYSTGKAFRFAKSVGFAALPGDILFVKSPEHVCVLVEIVGDPSRGVFEILTCDYGQIVGGKAAGTYRKVPVTVKVTKDGYIVRVGARELVGFVDICRLQLDSPAILENSMDIGEACDDGIETDDLES